MAQLARGLDLLGSAVSYALDRAGQVTPRLLTRPTPCAGWDLEALLHHLSDSIDVLDGAITTGRVVPVPAGAPSLDPVTGLRRQASRLLATCASAGLGDHPVAIGDRRLAASMATVAGAIEITVHGWDISVACGARRPVPSSLAAVLFPIAPLFVTPQVRHGLFADPIPLSEAAFPGDRLVAFLGRQPS